MEEKGKRRGEEWGGEGKRREGKEREGEGREGKGREVKETHTQFPDPLTLREPNLPKFNKDREQLLPH